jgi:hypothetical protein
VSAPERPTLTLADVAITERYGDKRTLSPGRVGGELDFAARCDASDYESVNMWLRGLANLVEAASSTAIDGDFFDENTGVFLGRVMRTMAAALEARVDDGRTADGYTVQLSPEALAKLVPAPSKPARSRPPKVVPITRRKGGAS